MTKMTENPDCPIQGLKLLPIPLTSWSHQGESIQLSAEGMIRDWIGQASRNAIYRHIDRTSSEGAFGPKIISPLEEKFRGRERDKESVGVGGES